MFWPAGEEISRRAWFFRKNLSVGLDLQGVFCYTVFALLESWKEDGRRMGIFKKFGPHYAIERFGVMFIALVVAMATLVGMITNTQIQRQRIALSGQAMYTSGFRMSETGTGCYVRGLYVDSAQTKVLILLQFNDMSMIPTNASDYSLSVAAVNTRMQYEMIESAPAGLFYMFGSTGYAAIYLQDMSGFPSQILGVSIAANTKLVTGSDSGAKDTGYVYFNPGGAYATRAAFLDERQWSFFEMVEEVMTRKDEIAARNTLTQDLEAMLQQLVLINEYKRRLTEELHVIIPVTPAYVDDTIYAVPTEELKTTKLADCTHLLLENYTTERGGWLTSSGEKGYYGKDVTLFLDARAVVPGGHDFTWQTGRILTGYLPYLTESTDVLVWRNYMNRKAGSYNPDLLAFNTEVKRFQWLRADGSTFDVLQKEDPRLIEYNENEQQINSVILLLIEAWEQYYELKVKYEKEDLPALLSLEINANDMLKSYTVNTNGIKIY